MGMGDWVHDADCWWSLLHLQPTYLLLVLVPVPVPVMILVQTFSVLFSIVHDREWRSLGRGVSG